MPPRLSFPDNTLSLVVNNISNYYDLLHLKQTNHHNYSLIQNETPFLPKIAEIYPSGFKYRLTMNVLDISYEEEQQLLYGRSLAKRTYTDVPKSPTFEEMNYVKFCFSAPNISSKSRKMVHLTLLLDVAKKTIIITFNNRSTITREVTHVQIKSLISKLIKLYHKRTPKNAVFIVLKSDNTLDIMVTDNKFNSICCVRIE